MNLRGTLSPMLVESEDAKTCLSLYWAATLAGLLDRPQT